MANEKFSQFAAGGSLQTGDTVVGLRSGINTKFNVSNTANETVYEACRLVSVTPYNTTYNNGVSGVGATLTSNINQTLIVDSFSTSVGDRILINGQSNPEEDGIYVVTQSGSGLSPFILTRATDFDTPAKIVEGGMIPIFDGNDYVASIWVVLFPVNTIGVDNITLSSTMEQCIIKFAFLQSANNLLDVASPIIAYDNLSPANLKGEIVSHNGLTSAALGAGPNGYVLEADSTQPLGLKWSPSATPVFVYPYTFTGQIIFATTFAPELQGFTDNSVLFINGGSGQITQDNANFSWDDINFNFNASNGSTIITSVQSALVGGHGHSMTNTIRSSAVGADISILNGCGNSVIIGGYSHSLQPGNNNVILGGNFNTISGNQSIAAGVTATVSGDYSFLWCDGSVPTTLSMSNAFSIIAQNGVGIGTASPQSSSILDIVSTTKAVRLPQLANTAAVATPAAGHIMFDNSTNQFVGYNGSAWVILG